MILVNGEVGSRVCATDRGLAYGDGVFRTLSARAGRPLQWRRQYGKLARDCAALALPPPPPDVLEREVAIACREFDRCAVKIVVTRGPGRRGYACDETCAATRVVIASARPPDPPEYARAGVAVRRCTLALSHQPALAGIKHLNRLENVLARAEWSDPAIHEGILCDIAGHAICGTMTNLFIGSGDTLATPQLDRCGVAGVTRDRVIEAAARAGIACIERPLSWEEVLAANEIFLTNSLIDVWPVRAIEGRSREPGTLTRQMQRALAEDDDEAAA